MGFIIMIIVAIVLGALAEMITRSEMPFGWLGNILAALVGSFIGTALFGNFGPEVGGFYILPTVIGAIIAIVIAQFIMRMMVSRRTL